MENKRISPLVPILIVVVILLSVLCFKFYVEKISAEEAYYELVEEQEENNRNVALYQEEYNKIVGIMLEDGVNAENCGNTIKKVWGNSILKEHDDETDKYTISNGEFVSDFNDALSALFSDSEFGSNVSRLSTSQNGVRVKMKDMVNPPEGYEEAYKSLENMYQSYLTFTNIVINCNGSLQSFNDEFAQADEEFSKCYNMVELYIK